MVETMVLAGVTVKLVVPSGYCKLDRKFEADAAFFSDLEKEQSTSERLLLAFGDCESVRLLRTQGVMRERQVSFGTYSLIVGKDGTPLRAPPDMTRATGLAGIYATLPRLDLTSLSENGERLIVEQGQETTRPSGTLDMDQNAVYIGTGGRKAVPQGETRYRRMIVVTAATILSGLFIGCSLIEPPAAGSPFAAMLQKQKAWSADLVQANDR